MELDLCLNEELCEAGSERIRDCLSVMQRYWSNCSASNARKRKEWAELLNDLEKLPLKFKICELRRELVVMWERCFKSEREKKAFAEFYSDDYSEDLLNKHTNELEKLHAFYTQHKELIELIAKYDEMWKSVLSIQEQSQNPERLFKNRGAQLLKEEHDRKLVSKIPQMQSNILKAIKKKESEGTVFLIRGEHFHDIVMKHNSKKDEKKTVKRTPVSSVASFGPSSKRSRTVEHTGISNFVSVNEHRKAVRQLQMK